MILKLQNIMGRRNSTEKRVENIQIYRKNFKMKMKYLKPQRTQRWSRYEVVLLLLFKGLRVAQF